MNPTGSPFEINRRGVKEHQIEFAEQVAAAVEPSFFGGVLAAAGHEGRRPWLLFDRPGLKRTIALAPAKLTIARFTTGRDSENARSTRYSGVSRWCPPCYRL